MAFDKTCSFRKKPGHGADRCVENPDRDRSCANCGRKAHGMDSCPSKQKAKPEIKDDEGHQAFVGDDDAALFPTMSRLQRATNSSMRNYMSLSVRVSTMTKSSFWPSNGPLIVNLFRNPKGYELMTI